MVVLAVRLLAGAPALGAQRTVRHAYGVSGPFWGRQSAPPGLRSCFQRGPGAALLRSAKPPPVTQPRSRIAAVGLRVCAPSFQQVSVPLRSNARPDATPPTPQPPGPPAAGGSGGCYPQHPIWCFTGLLYSVFMSKRVKPGSGLKSMRGLASTRRVSDYATALVA